MTAPSRCELEVWGTLALLQLAGVIVGLRRGAGVTGVVLFLSATLGALGLYLALRTGGFAPYQLGLMVAYLGLAALALVAPHVLLIPGFVLLLVAMMVTDCLDDPSRRSGSTPGSTDGPAPSSSAWTPPSRFRQPEAIARGLARSLHGDVGSLATDPDRLAALLHDLVGRRSGEVEVLREAAEAGQLDRVEPDADASVHTVDPDAVGDLCQRIGCTAGEAAWALATWAQVQARARRDQPAA